jgi:hypothetical protein
VLTLGENLGPSENQHIEQCPTILEKSEPSDTLDEVYSYLHDKIEVREIDE